MQYRWGCVALYFITILAVGACGPSGQLDGDGGTGDDDCPNRCTSFGWEECLTPGEYADPIACPDDEVCIPETGCGVCYPGTRYCVDNEVWSCNDDGDGGEFVEECQGDKVCSNGVCKTPCERAEDLPSNVGCHFWAVDLDNEAVTSDFIENDAAAQQYAVAIANNGDKSATVRIYRNTGRVGDPLQEDMVIERQVAAGSLEQIDLPQREVDGTMGQNASYDPDTPAHTFASPHAYRIETTEPVVAYQFNPIIQQYSNDASILIPRQALAKNYYVLGYPTANPCGPPPGDPLHQQSIPDRTAITIICAEDDTDVTVIPTHPIVGSSGDSGIDIPQTPAGTPLSFTIDAYDVVNLESDQPQVGIQQCLSMLERDGDFTGTLVQSSKRVAVFSSLERGIGTGGADPPDPPDWDGETCCTDHLEQQMFPTAALGWEFAISRSPVRSTDPNYQEPDIYRVMATTDGTTVLTNLDPPHNRFDLDAGEFAAFYAYEGFTLSSQGGAVMLGQYLVSQGLIPQGGIGDPTFVVFPAAEQHREEYVFLVPTTFSQNYMVLAMPQNAAVMVDGSALGEFNDCVEGPIGTVQNIEYKQLTCPMSEGVHTVSSNMPLGLTVYGYYNVGSYGYPGGSDVNIINPVE